MKKVAIVGAGISGLVLSSFLKKKGNFQISIFEKDNIFLNNLNGIQISPNAIRILNKINFNFFNLKKKYSVKGISFYDCETKKKIGVMKFDYLEKNMYVTLNRNDLINFLINQFSLKDNLIQKEVKSVKNNSIFLKGEKRLDFDLVIVSDGIFSKLRSQHSSIIYSGYSAHRGSYVSNDQKKYIDLWMGKNFHLVKYPIDNMKNNSFTLIKKERAPDDISNYNCEIKNFYSQFNKILPSDTHEIFNSQKVKIWPIYKLNDIIYGINNICYIGDSAHGFIPSRAQGAAQAIEDAFVSYNLIVKNKMYADELNKIRKKRIKKIIKKSENNLILFHQNIFLLRSLRNFCIKLLCSSKFLIKIINSYIFDYDYEKTLK
tara:strand:- start:4552 stop:5673 length:1122 start_codon:yes stop_codon:yes gene_type:complete